MDTEFTALEYCSDATFAPVHYRFQGSSERGWTVQRNGRSHLHLGTGYRLLRSEACGVCSTDLARQHLPFPLPQIIGHEVTALDDQGRRYAIEINASHRARGVDHQCAFCRVGVDTHCPDRLVLGIHDLPGGFGPYVLAPVRAALPVPADISARCGVFIEPLAAAFHAVEVVNPKPGDRIAVLGPRKLGMLIIAALAAHRRQHALTFTIVAWARRRELLRLAEALGADETQEVEGESRSLPRLDADVVIDTSGNPAGLELALRLARREVHLKSTHGRSAAGVEKLTAFVVDELELACFPADEGMTAGTRFDEARGVNALSCVAWLSASDPPRWLSSRARQIIRGSDASTVLAQIESDHDAALPRADVAVVDTAAQVDAVIRPSAMREVSLIRPRGAIYVVGSSGAGDSSPLVRAVATRNLSLTSSRCGSFAEPMRFLASDPSLRAGCERLITHTFGPHDLAQAFRVAGSVECIKAVVEHRA